MNEQDLEQAREIFKKRKFVQGYLDNMIAVETLGLKHVQLNLNFLKTKDAPGGGFGHAVLDATSGLEICALARKLLEEQLSDIDASLRAFGCEPPKQALPAEIVRLPPKGRKAGS